MKHTPSWEVTRSSDGTTTWTTPTGLVIAHPAQPVLPRARVRPRASAGEPDAAGERPHLSVANDSTTDSSEPDRDLTDPNFTDPNADPDRHDTEFIRLRRAVNGPSPPSPTPPPPPPTWDLDDEPPF